MVEGGVCLHLLLYVIFAKMLGSPEMRDNE